MRRPLLVGLLASIVGILGLAACSKGPSIDWEAPENYFVVEKTEKTPEGALMEFHSLVDAPAKYVYDALSDVENYAKFVDGVQDTKLVSAEGNTKVIEIAQTVIGRQARARVKWTFDPAASAIRFETLESDANYNDGSYKIYESPDGQRCYIISKFHVQERTGQYVPIGILESATRDSFEKAARSVKRRVTGKE